LKIGTVIIIPGDSDQEEVVKREIGRASARILSKVLGDGSEHVVAVSGGTTLAAMAANITGSQPKTVIVPARGGLGDNVELQANTIATVLAQKLNASYRQLYVPDGVSEDILNSILQEDIGVRTVVDIIKRADILVHGMGRASDMARHRRLPQEVITKLEEGGAVGEAFGQYVALDGTQIYTTNNAGLMLQDLQNIGTIIGIAGGKSKAAAILSVIRASRQDILVTDEAAAREIVRMV
ncbi:MAG: DNA-binding transcriptional regulator, partial [Phascolarctobacterium sp.]|nr:DNA-binding transcriptional regulator [Phascolarctobacterium sp.]